MRTRPRMPLSLALLVTSLISVVSSPRIAAQEFTDPGWGLTQVTCIQGVFGGPITSPVNNLTPDGVFCRDFQISANFGHIFASAAGQCENGLPVGAVTLEARWIDCSTVLAGEADVNIDSDTIPDPLQLDCDNPFVTVGGIDGNATIRDFFLGTLLAAGLGGFANCAGEFRDPISPSISSC